MLDFSSYIHLPSVWGVIIAISIFLYVLLDGFDLGVGILFPFAPSNACRDVIMHSVAPFWDGNETWLVLGGGALFIAFPLAYAILLPAFYIPIILMLLGLIFRGVAFEFRFKSHEKFRRFWDYVFHFGSLVAAFMQGIMLGAYVTGVEVQGRSFSGESLDWLTPFSLMTGVSLVFGYALLGANWLLMKTTGITQAWARNVSLYALLFVLFFIGLVSLWVPFLKEFIATRWFSFPNIVYLIPIPILTGITAISLFYTLVWKKHEIQPFVLTIALFVLCYIGLGVSLWPWIVPYKVSFIQAAADPSTQTLMFIGVAILFPLILGYTAYSYYVFRGKVTHPVEY